MKTSLNTMLKRIKDRNWRVTHAGEIRCKTGGCPLTAAGYVINPVKFHALGGNVSHTMGYDFGARAIGYSGNVDDLVNAVDRTEIYLKTYYKEDAPRLIKIRKQVLKEFGLKESKGKTLADWKKEQ